MKPGKIVAQLTEFEICCARCLEGEAIHARGKAGAAIIARRTGWKQHRGQWVHEIPCQPFHQDRAAGTIERKGA